jgi:hypothetical protein
VRQQVVVRYCDRKFQSGPVKCWQLDLSGEAAIHSLTFAETGVPVLLGLFCEVNTTVRPPSFSPHCTGIRH